MATALCLVATGAYAQKASVKAAEKLAKDKPAEARRLATEARAHEETKNDPLTWLVSGNIEQEAFQQEFMKAQLGQKYDEAKMHKAVVAEVPYLLRVYELENVPDAKGRVRLRHAKKAQAILRADHGHIAGAGNYYLSQEKYKEASDAFKAYLDIALHPMMAEDKTLHTPQQDTLNAEVAFYATYSSLQAKDYDQVLVLTEQFKDIDLKRNELNQIRYNALLAKGDTVKGMELLEQGISQFPNELFYLANLTDRYIAKGEYDKAKGMLLRGIEQDPKNAIFKQVLAGIYEQQEQWDEAEKIYRAMLSDDKASFDANYNLGRMLYNKAIELFNHANPTKLTDDQAKGFLEQALPYLEKAYEIDKDKVAYVLKNVYYRLGNTARYNEINQ